MGSILYSCFLLFSATLCLSTKETIDTYQIGAVLSSPTYGQAFMDAIANINQEPSALPPNVQLNGTFIEMNDNPIGAARSLCDDVIPSNVSFYILLLLISVGN